MDVLVITALADELEAVLTVELEGRSAWEKTSDRQQLPYYVREIEGRDGRPLVIAAADTGMGEPAAAARAASLISELDPRCVAMCGICAGRRGSVSLGDVIVADRIYRYDHGKLIRQKAADAAAEDFLHDIETYNLDASWRRDLEDLARTWVPPETRPVSKATQRASLLRALLIHEKEGSLSPLEDPLRGSKWPEWNNIVDALFNDGLVDMRDEALTLTDTGRKSARKNNILYPDGPVEPPPRVHLGPIATGATVREDHELFKRLTHLVRKTLGVEMEAAAIGLAAHLSNRRALVIKAVSDHADEEKDDQFRHYACRASAHFLLKFLRDRVDPAELRRGRRDEPRYESEESRHQAEALADALQRRKRLHGEGVSMESIDGEIRELKRSMREDGVLRAGDVIGERYLLVERLGEGGFATVWKARDDERSDALAIKVLHPHLAGDPLRLARFRRGARAMAELDHPAILRVLDEPGQEGKWHYFTMELLGGGDLLQAVREKRVHGQRGLELVRKVADALIYAHDRGLVHRDIKPSNILLDAEGQPHLGDFDLVAAANTSGGTRTGALGSAVYAAPEILERPQHVDVRADVYSLGMTAIFVLHGEEISFRVLRDLNNVLNALPCNQAVRDVLRRAVEPDPERRFADARAFCGALDAAVSSHEEPGVTLRMRRAQGGFGAWRTHTPRTSKGLILELRARPEDFREPAHAEGGTVARGVRDAWSRAGVLTEAARDLFLLAQAEGRRGVAALAIALEAPPSSAPGASGAIPEGTVLVVMEPPDSESGWDIWVDARDAFWVMYGERARSALEAEASEPLVIDVVDAPRFNRRTHSLLSQFQRSTSRFEGGGVFVDPPVRIGEQVTSALSALDAWLASEACAALVVGPFGSGKSAILSAFCRALAGRAGAPWPVLVTIAGVAAERDVDELVLDAAGSTDTPASRAALALLVRRHMLLPCFDGLDERPLGPQETFTERLERLFGVAGGEGRALVSLREPPMRELAHVCKPKDGAHQIGVEPLDTKRIQVVLTDALGEPAARLVWTRIEADADLTMLVQRPALLAMTMQIIARREPAARLSADEVFGAYFEQWRDATSAGANAALSAEVREALAEALAESLFSMGYTACAWSEFRPGARQRLEPMLGGLSGDAALAEIADGALLTREDGERYGFAHPVVRAFFLARGFIRSIPSRPVDMLSARPFTPEIVRMLAMVGPRQEDRGPLLHAAEALLQGPKVGIEGGIEGASEEEGAEARANALRILLGLAREAGEPGGWVPEGADLRGVCLPSESLAGARLTGARLIAANLSGADLTDVDLSGADLSGARLCGARLVRTNLRGARLIGANLTYVAMSGCDLTDADLTGAVLGQSVWTTCHVGGVKLTGAKMTACVLPNGMGAAGAAVSPRSLEVTIACGHGKSVKALAWDPSGSRLASGDRAATLLVWDVASGALLERLHGHKQEFAGYTLKGVTDVAWDPSDARLASAGSDGTLRIWDVGLGREVLELRHLDKSSGSDDDVQSLNRRRNPLSAVAWDSTGARIASGGSDGVRVWDSQSGTELVHLNQKNNYGWYLPSAERLAWDSTGYQILLGSTLESLIVDTRSGKVAVEVRAPKEDSGPTAVAVAWDDRGPRAVVGDEKGTMWLIPVRKDGEPKRIGGHQSSVLALHLRGERIAVGSQDRSARVWDLQRSRETARSRDHRGAVYAVTLDPRGLRVATGDGFGNLRVWDIREGSARLRLEGHPRVVSSLAWDSAGARLASSHVDGSVRIWDTNSGRTLAFWQTDGWGTMAAWDPTGTRLAGAFMEGMVRVWDVRSMEETARLEVDGRSEAEMYSVEWDGAGKRIACATAAGPHLWDVATRSGRSLWKPAAWKDDSALPYLPSCRDMTWSPDGKRVATAMADGLVRVYDVLSSKEEIILTGHERLWLAGVTSVSWHPKADILASSGGDGTVRVWDASSGRELSKLSGHESLVDAVEWDAAGARIASASWDGTVRIWDVSSGCELACLKAEHDPAHAVAWDPAGRRLASAGTSGAIRIWDGTSHQLLCTLEAAGRRSLARTPGGYCLLDDGKMDGPPFCLAVRRPERPGSVLYLPLGGLRDILHHPEKVEAALQCDLTSDGELERDLEAVGISGGGPWDGEWHVIPEPHIKSAVIS